MFRLLQIKCLFSIVSNIMLYFSQGV